MGIEAVPLTLSGAITGPSEERDGVQIPVEVKLVGNVVILKDHFVELEACVDAPPNRDEWRDLLGKARNTMEAGRRLLSEY